jgi:large subunit ribosomal protein L30
MKQTEGLCCQKHVCNQHTLESGSVIRIQQIGSPIRCPNIQRLNLKSLGLRRMNQIRELKDTPEIRGLLRKIPHLVRVIKEQSL